MGLFGRKRDVFGLDLGSSAIKAVQLRPSNSGYELMAFGMVELPPDTIREGTIREPGTVVDGIREAVKKAKVNEYLTVIQEADLNPVVVDVDAFALENQFELNHPEMANEVVALIDMGASVMKTNVLRRGGSVFARDIAFGGNDYTEAIAHRLNLPFER